MRIEDGRLTDVGSGVSFALPGGWELDPKSVSSMIRLRHPATGSDLSIGFKADAEDLKTEFQGLRMVMPFLGGRWSKVVERMTKLGKLKAGEIESQHEPERGQTRHEWHLVCVRDNHALLLVFTTPESEAKARKADLESIKTSFEWRTP